MNQQETEIFFSTVNNVNSMPEIVRDITVRPLEVTVVLPQGLNERNSIDHPIDCFIEFDADFNEIYKEGNPVQQEVVRALLMTLIREEYRQSDKCDATFLGELLLDAQAAISDIPG